MAWEKGKSANPGGRPRIVQAVRRRAQGHMDEALDIALKVMRESEKPSEQLAAAIQVLKMAGVAFTPDNVPDEQNKEPLTPEATEADLLEAATAGEG